MSIDRNILISVIFALVQDFKIVAAEWVEIPQFSDEAKVYRVPFTKYVRGDKYFLENQGGPTIYSFPNISAVDEGFRKIKIHHQSATDRFPKPSLSSENLPPISPTKQTIYKLVTTEASITERPQNVNHFFEDTIFEDEAATVETEDEEVSVTTSSFGDKIVVDEDQPFQTIPNVTRPEEGEKPEEEDDSKPSFLAYIPVELFKKVHATLQSQPSTTKGKLSFLKRFEIALLAEIQKRLVPVINPVRRKRESRGDHGWDDGHDEGLGFPSLEGSLMAISFLTFAVYLVQLVMMLFRNLGNTTATTGTATFLVNRNKRSVEEFTEDTARILDYLDTFAQSQFTEN